MHFSPIHAILLAAVFAQREGAANANHTSSAITKYAFVDITEFQNTDGSRSYSWGMGFYFDTPNRMETLASPSGFIVDRTESVKHRDFLPSFDDVQQEILGEWIFRTSPMQAPLNFEEYRFTLNPFDLEAIALAKISISPPSGTRVSSPFLISWNPSSRRHAYGYETGLDVRGELISPGLLQVSFPMASANNSAITFSTWSERESLISFASPLTVPVDPFYNFQLNFTFSRHISAEYLLIPEPAHKNIACLGFSMIALLSYARRELLH